MGASLGPAPRPIGPERPAGGGAQRDAAPVSVGDGSCDSVCTAAAEKIAVRSVTPTSASHTVVVIHVVMFDPCPKRAQQSMNWPQENASYHRPVPDERPGASHHGRADTTRSSAASGSPRE